MTLCLFFLILKLYMYEEQKVQLEHEPSIVKIVKQKQKANNTQLRF